MTLSDERCTAKAVQYRKFIGSPIMNSQGALDGTLHNTSTSSPTLNQDSRKYDTIYPDTNVRDGRATHLSRPHRRSEMSLAQHSINWESKHSTGADRLSGRDRHLACNVRPCMGAPSPTSGLAMHPLWHQAPPSPIHFSSEFSTRRPLPKSYYLGERLKSRLAIRNAKNIDSDTAPSSHPTRVTSEDQCKVQKDENMHPRQRPPVSYLSEEFLRDGIARNMEQADYLRDQREKGEAEERKEKRRKEAEKEEAKRKTNSTAEKKLKVEDAPIWLKDLARGWREKYPGSKTLFRKDFNFGPKMQTDQDDDYQRPLSPCSSVDTLSNISSEICTKALKRQRHDSANTDVARESPHNRLHATSSPIPIHRPQPTNSSSRPLFRGLQTLEAHPGQRVNFDACIVPELEVNQRNRTHVRLSMSDFDCDGVQDYIRTRNCEPVELEQENGISTTPQVMGQDGCCKEDIRHHLETVFAQQGQLKNSAEDTQAAVDEELRMKTCNLQRKLRTRREHPPVLFEPVLRCRTAEPQVTKWSPVMYSLDRTNIRQAPVAGQCERHKRRSSFVARCRSTDVFLRDVRESQRRRQQLAREGEYEGSTKQNAPDPRAPGPNLDWLGVDPL